MTIEKTLDDELKRALKARDRGVVDAIRMIKTRITEKRTSAGFSGSIDDALIQDLISSYVKSLNKAIAEMEKGGGGASPVLAKYRFEIGYLEGFLPARMSEEQVRELVRGTIGELGVTGPGAVGRVMGQIMKAHREEVDGDLVRRIVEEELRVGSD